jgi:predicted dienelactone hydrolase
VIALLALACQTAPSDADTGTAPFDPVASYGAPGPWAVGHTTTAVTYTEPDGSARTLRLALWWPTDDTSGTPGRYWNNLVPAPNVWEDASVAPGPFPLAVFSHGHQGYAENSSFLTEHLASHGWVVAAPDHTGNTSLDGADRTTDIYAQRPRDLSAVLDHLEGRTDPLGAALDRAGGLHAVAIGHSFGGYTVFAAMGGTYDEAALACPDPTTAFCSTMTPAAADVFRAGFADPRFTRAIAMAPGDADLFGAGATAVDAPVFLLGGTLDPGGDGQPYWDAMGADARHLRLVLTGAGHQSFTDYSGVLEDFDGLLDPTEGFRLIEVYTLAWALAAVGDDRGASILDGSTAVGAAAVLTPGGTTGAR